MSNKLRKTFMGNGKTAQVSYNKDFEEYTVKFFVANVHQTKADYHTDNFEDACGTARLHCGGIDPVTTQ